MVLVFLYVVVLVKKMLVVVIVYLVDDCVGLHADIYLDHDAVAVHDEVWVKFCVMLFLILDVDIVVHGGLSVKLVIFFVVLVDGFGVHVVEYREEDMMLIDDHLVLNLEMVDVVSGYSGDQMIEVEILKLELLEVKRFVLKKDGIDTIYYYYYYYC